MTPRDWGPEPEMDEEEGFRTQLTAAAEAAGYPRVEIGRFVVSGEREWVRALELGDVQMLALAAALRGVASHGGHAAQRQDDDEDTPGTRNEFRFEGSGGVVVGDAQLEDDTGEDTDADGEDEEEEGH